MEERSSDSDDEIQKADEERISKELGTSPVSPPQPCSCKRILRDIPLSRVDEYFFKYSAVSTIS